MASGFCFSAFPYFFLLILSFAFCCNCAPLDGGPPPPGGYYTTRYDHVDVDNILNQKRLVLNYAKCFFNQGPCTAQGIEFKQILPEAIRTNCLRCTEKQKYVVQRSLRRLAKEHPQVFKEIVAHWDPQKRFIPIILSGEAPSNEIIQEVELGNRFGEIPSDSDPEPETSTANAQDEKIRKQIEEEIRRIAEGRKRNEEERRRLDEERKKIAEERRRNELEMKRIEEERRKQEKEAAIKKVYVTLPTSTDVPPLNIKGSASSSSISIKPKPLSIDSSSTNIMKINPVTPSSSSSKPSTSTSQTSAPKSTLKPVSTENDEKSVIEEKIGHNSSTTKINTRSTQMKDAPQKTLIPTSTTQVRTSTTQVQTSTTTSSPKSTTPRSNSQLQSTNACENQPLLLTKKLCLKLGLASLKLSSWTHHHPLLRVHSLNNKNGRRRRQYYRHYY